MTTQTTIKCYRWVKDDMTSENDSKTLWKVGEWKKIEGKIKICEKGLHACKNPYDSMKNIYGNRWFLAESKGNIIEKGDKFVASEMRLIKELPNIIWKRFALFCAKECEKNYQKEYQNDKRVSDCNKATEDYLDGKIKIEELEKARSAAWSAVRSAVRSAARSAAFAAWSAAWSAVRSAAWSAACAAESAASAASAENAIEERQKKELNRLVELYSEEYMNEVLWTPQEKCENCQGEMERIECTFCDKNGFMSHDCGEDTCACLDDSPNVLCDTCDGRTCWWVCPNCIKKSDEK